MHINSLPRILPLLLLLAIAGITLPGCGRDMTPQTMDANELEAFVESKPEGLEVEDVVETDDDDDGSGD